MPVLLLIVAVAILPVALAKGGHNGATFAGVAILILAIALTIATSPRKGSK